LRILFFISHGLIARNFEWVLEELDDRGHRVHVALDHLDKPGVAGTTAVLERIAGARSGVTFGPAPAHRPHGLRAAGRGFRLLLDYVSYLDRGPGVASAPRERARRAIPGPIRSLATRIVAVAGGRRALRALLELGDRGVPVDRTLRHFVDAFDPDAVLVSPLVDPGSPQTDYVRCARALAIPSMLAVHSWDNLTLKGTIREIPDRVAVWNQAQRDEAVRLHGVPPARILVTGAPAYDHWRPLRPGSSRADFCSSVGLDPGRPYVLYLGSSRFIAPDESDFFHDWSLALARAPELEGLQVLARPHPLNPFAPGASDGVSVMATAAIEPSDSGSRARYFDAIYHAAAVVGVLTSGMVEAAIVDRPVHTLLDDRYRATQQELPHFRHLLPEGGGMLIVAHDNEEHIMQIGQSLARAGSPLNQQFIASFVWGGTASIAASKRVVDAIEGLTLPQLPIPEPLLRNAAAALVARLGWVVYGLISLIRGARGSV
jgi:hypothetical protein